MVRLTAALISAIQDGADIASITSLIVPGRDLDQLVGLEVCGRLTRLDLSNNRLTSIEGLTLCTKLQWLSVARNQITSLKGVEKLTNLTVLNASRNHLSSLKEVADLKELRALIFNENEITKVCRLDRLTNLNTLVLSRNPLKTLGNFASKLSSLRKLSLSHCSLQVIGRSLKRCVALEELRLAHNVLWVLPQELETNGRLSILDLGNNHVKSWSDTQILDKLPSLVNLNLRGNPLCSEPGYADEVTKRFPYLQILDGHPVQLAHEKRGRKVAKELSKSKESDPDRGAEKWPEHTASVKLKKQKTGDVKTADNNPDDRPFLETISMPATDSSSLAVTEAIKGADNPGRVKGTEFPKTRKDDSGVVCVIDRSKGRRATPLPSKIEMLLSQELEVGSGRASTWDDSGPAVSAVEALNSKERQIDQSEPKPYSRWALKKTK